MALRALGRHEQAPVTAVVDDLRDGGDPRRDDGYSRTTGPPCAVVVVPSERGSEAITWTSNAGYHRSTSPRSPAEEDRVRECQLVRPARTQLLLVGEVGLGSAAYDHEPRLGPL